MGHTVNSGIMEEVQSIAVGMCGTEAPWFLGLVVARLQEGTVEFMARYGRAGPPSSSQACTRDRPG